MAREGMWSGFMPRQHNVRELLLSLTGVGGWMVPKAKFHVVVKRETPITALHRTPWCISAPQKTPHPYYKDQAVNLS